MKTAIICIIGLVGSWGYVGAEPLIEGRVRLPSGAPVAGAQVRLFDLTNLRAAPIGATTDQSGYFTLSLGALPGTALTERFKLGSNYPNPFNPSTLIPYQLPSSMHVRLEVFNLLGQRIATLVDGEQSAGFHTAKWEGTDATGQAVGAGVYLYRLSGDAGKITRRMVLVDGQAGAASAGSAASAMDETGPAWEPAITYGLTVSAPGLVPYVDPDFRVTAGMSPLDVVVETPSSIPRAKVASGGILGDVDNTGRVDFLDALLVALYSRDSSTVMPNGGDISLGDVNADGRVDLSDLWILTAYLDDPTDPTLPAGIGESVGPAASLSPDAPDLVVEALTVNDSTAIAGVSPPGGGTFLRFLNFTVRNQGSGTSKEAWLRYYRSIDGTVSTSWAPIRLVVDSLSASESIDESRSFDVPSAAGTYNYWVCVLSVPADADTTNNCSATVTLTVGNPDLVVDSLTVSDSSPISGTEFTLSATVRNRGSVSPGGNPTLRFYQSTDANITTGDTIVSGNRAISVLGPSSTTTRSGDFTAPATPGTYYYGACVVPVSGESDTTNNCSKGVMVVVGGAPDLVVDTPTVSNISPKAGRSFTASVTVRNQGHASVDTLRYEWDWAADSGFNSIRKEARTYGVNGLGPLGTSTESITLWAPTSPGTYYLNVCMFPLPNELDIYNNCSAAVTITVVAAPPPGPDLVVDTPTADDIYPGTFFSLHAMVRNQGDEASEAATLLFYHSADSTITTSDVRVGAGSTISGLSPTATDYLSDQAKAPSTPGTYYYGACVVSSKGESNTANNCSPALAVVVMDQPDLVVKTPWISHETPDPTRWVDLHAVVRNQGAGPVQGFPATRFEVFVSTDSTLGLGDTSVHLHLWRHGNLSSGSEEGITVSFHSPSTAGEYHYYACVEQVEGESDTTNNCSEAVKVTVEPADLMLLLPVVSSNVMTAGDIFTLRATVLNRGSLRADNTDIRYFRSTDATITSMDTHVGTQRVNYLKAHETSDKSIVLAAPDSSGTYYYGACVDTVSGETDTTNNCSEAVEVTVGPKPVSLRITSSFVFQEQHFVRFRVTAHVPLNSVVVKTYQIDRRNNTLHLMETTEVGNLLAGGSYEKLTTRYFPAHLRRHLTIPTASVEWAGGKEDKSGVSPTTIEVPDLRPPPSTYTPSKYAELTPTFRQLWILWEALGKQGDPDDPGPPNYQGFFNCGISQTRPCLHQDHIGYYNSLPPHVQRCAFVICDAIKDDQIEAEKFVEEAERRHRTGG